jgi:hypothetical protein
VVALSSAPSLGHQLATLVLEVVGVCGAVGVLVALTVGRRPRGPELRLASGAVVGVIAVALAVGGLPSGVSVLSDAERSSVSARDGVDYCFGQDWPQNPGGAGLARLPFVQWARALMGPRAIYSVDYTPPPDPDCLYLGLLPALPARPGERAQWTIAYGSVPPQMQALIAAHDPSVRVFASGFAVEFNGKR